MNQNTGTNGSSVDQAKVKRRRHRKPGKDMVYRCLVCEDVALNYNFTVISCESCKAFFRRNVDTPNRFHCPNHYSCKVTKETRKHCPACRLKKCFDVGMRKELPGMGPDGSTPQQFAGFDGSCKLEPEFVLQQQQQQQYGNPMGQGASYVHARMLGAASNFAMGHGMDIRQLNMLGNASAPQGAGGMMNAPGCFSNADGGQGLYGMPGNWHTAKGGGGGAGHGITASAMHAQMDSMAAQLGGVALSGNCQSLQTMGGLRVGSSTSSSSFEAASAGTGQSDAQSGGAAGGGSNLCGNDTMLHGRADVEAISPAAFSSPTTCALNSPYSSLAEQSGVASWATASQGSQGPIKHRLKRMRSPPGAGQGAGGLYDSPASNASSASSVDGVCPMPGRSNASAASSVLFTQPTSSNTASPAQPGEAGSELLCALPTVFGAASGSGAPSPSNSMFASLASLLPAVDSPSSSSVVFDRDGVCASSSALLSADEFKQALETCTRFSTMMQAPFSTAELGALMSNPLPENAFESSVYAEMALRRYVHSLKRLEEFSRLDRGWQLFVLRRALITAHSVNVGFYTDVERRAFLCPREDGSCLYLNEAYFYRTFDKMRSGALDFGALMKPLMAFHVSMQTQFATQWTIVLAAMSLTVLFATHYYVTPPSSTSVTSAVSLASPSSTSTVADERPTANAEAAHSRSSDAAPPYAAMIQQFAKMAGVKLPANLDIRDFDMASLAQHFPGLDLPALANSFQHLNTKMPGSEAAVSGSTAGSSEAAAAGSSNPAPPGIPSMESLEAFGLCPPPPGLVDAIEPMHKKYLYFLHDYVLLLHSNAERAATSWRFCSDKLEEIRRIANVFTQQAFFFIAQNPQLGGMLIPLMNEIISSTPS